MKYCGLILAGLLLHACSVLSAGAALVDRLLAPFAGVKSISCEIRRDWPGPDGRVRMNSRVHWQRPLMLHVDNFSPMRRRYVCDGDRLFYYIEGDPRGFSRRVEELDRDWRLRLEVVPGSPMERLLPLRGAEEIILDDSPDGMPRRGYRLDNAYVVLQVDAENRLVSYRRYSSEQAEHPLLVIVYSSFSEVSPGAWLPLRHEARVSLEDGKRIETTRVSLIGVNEPMPSGIFSPEAYFAGVDFVDSFDKIYR